MWFMTKIANPLVGVILRSPLHRILSATLLLITYRGRKSGKEYTLPVQYVQQHQSIYIIPGEAEKKTWWRNLRGGAPVQLLLVGRKLAGRAIVLEGERDAELIAPALDLYLERFPSVATMHHLDPRADGSFDPQALRLAAFSLVMVRVDLEDPISI